MSTAKKFRHILLLFFAVFLVSACSQQKAAAPLKNTTKLDSTGIVTKAQLATIKGKTGDYAFTGKSAGKIGYTWTYSGKQIQNPEKQKLAVAFQTTGLEAIKKKANQAAEVLAIQFADFHLAGSPTLTITLSTSWQADHAVLVTQVNGQLQQLSAAAPRLKVTAKQTTITLKVTAVSGTYYLVAGKQATTAASTVADSQIPTATVASSEAAAAATTASSATAETKEAPAETAATEAASSAAESTSVSAAADTKTPDNQATTPTKQEPTTKQPAADTAKTSKQVTISINCSTILANQADLAKGKAAFVPADGWILKPTTITIAQDATVYDALVQVTKAESIQMEASWTPIYDAYYIEGINQLYEFDCGNLSGWMYKVDGWFPNYGASKYDTLQDGSVIEWVYTCDLGKDVGDSY